MIAPWITVDDLEDPTSPYAQEAIEAASFVLWMLSGRKYGGVRSVTEVYCQMGLDEVGMRFPGTYPANGGMAIWPVLDGKGGITNQVGGCCSSCGCPHLLRLRGAPILSVEAVYDQGREIPLSDVAIYDYSYLVAGNGCWNTCGELEVSYTYGAPPPAMGKIAARELANQYILAVSGDDACALPARVTQVSRQGVSWTLLDAQDFLDNGRTGIYTVDLFLRTVNPDQARMRARVFSPDVPRGKSYRWAGPAGFRAAAAAPTPAPYASPVQAMRTMSAPGGTATATVSSTDAPPSVALFVGRPLRWVVPGQYSADNPPVITAQPSGEEVPLDALLWRSGNYTLDLTTEQVERLLPPGSALVVSAPDSAQQTSYPVERRNP